MSKVKRGEATWMQVLVAFEIRMFVFPAQAGIQGASRRAPSAHPLDARLRRHEIDFKRYQYRNAAKGRGGGNVCGSPHMVDLTCLMAAIVLAPCSPAKSDQLFSTMPAEAAGFGTALAMVDGRLFVGEPLGLDGGGSESTGMVRVFQRQGWSWRPAGSVSSPRSVGGTFFGSAVATDSISAETVVVGAPGDDTDGSNVGRAYVFERTPRGEWALAATLSPPRPQPGQGFGWAVAMSGDVIVVGAPNTDTEEGGSIGVAYVFERGEGGAWLFVSELHPEFAVIPDGGGFGTAVAVEGGRAIVGAPYFGAEHLPGHVSFFERVDGAWNHVQTTSAINPGQRDRFGWSVAIRGDIAVAGAPRDLPPNIGTVVIFARAAGRRSLWTATAQVASPSPAPFDRFGASVSLSENHLAVGASTQDETGVVYLFERSGAQLGAHQVVAPADGAAFDLFGVRVVTDGEALISGSPQLDAAAPDAGGVYAYRVDGPTGDFDADCAVTGADLGLLLAAWSSGDPEFDLDGSGVVDGADLGILLAQWTA
jgi:hypothetical protein